MRLLSVFLTGSLVAWASTTFERKAQEATEAFQDFVSSSDDAIPEALLRRATCVVVIPDLMKGGLIFGARTGWGVGSCRTPTGWSGVSFFRLTGVSVGLQAGAQKTDLILVFTKKAAASGLSRAGLTLGAGLSLAVGPVGRDLEMDTDPRFKSAVYAYSRTKGFYAGLNLEGARLNPRVDLNRLASPGLSAEQILGGGFDRGLAPVELTRFVEALEARAP